MSSSAMGKDLPLDAATKVHNIACTSGVWTIAVHKADSMLDDGTDHTGANKQSPLSEIIGQSPIMVRLRAQVARLLSREIAGGRLPPLLREGATGPRHGEPARA